MEQDSILCVTGLHIKCSEVGVVRVVLERLLNNFQMLFSKSVIRYKIP